MAPIAIQENLTQSIPDIKSKTTVTVTSVGEDGVTKALTAAQTRFEDRNPRSKKQHEIAVESLPGGNTRTLLYTSPFPLCMKCGKGPFVWDEDGHK